MLSRIEMLGYTSIARFVFHQRGNFNTELISDKKVIRQIKNKIETSESFICVEPENGQKASVGMLSDSAKAMLEQLNGKMVGSNQIYELSIDNFWSSLKPLLPMSRYGFMAEDFSSDIVSSKI
jgi:hypothetical protein